MKKMLAVMVMAWALVLAVSSGVLADSVSVTYTSTASISGGYDLSFKVSNNMPASSQQGVYFWGIDLWRHESGVVSTELDLPQDWLTSLGSAPNWGYWGYAYANYDSGAQHIYYIPWATDYMVPSGFVAPGNSLSGFTVHTNVLPETIHFYAYSLGQYYEAPDREALRDTIPGPYELSFEGVAGQASNVPLPASLLLFGPGLAGLAVLRRRLKK